MSVSKRPWVFVCVFCVCVCCRDQVCEFDTAVPRFDASAADVVVCCVFQCVCLC